MQILSGHVSPETAYVVEDYPYGFRLRCRIRYWLEYQPKRGFRLCSQTSNPKVSGLVWNKPKASIYALFGGCMYLNAEGHVTWTGLTAYSTGAEAKAWSDLYRSGVPAEGLKTLDAWVAAKMAYDAKRQPGDNLRVGLVEAHKAWLDVQLAGLRAGNAENAGENSKHPADYGKSGGATTCLPVTYGETEG